MLRILYAQDIHHHRVDNLSLDIHLGVEGCGFGEIGVKL
jgi:hypothetical protein